MFRNCQYALRAIQQRRAKTRCIFRVLLGILAGIFGFSWYYASLKPQGQVAHANTIQNTNTQFRSTSTATQRNTHLRRKHVFIDLGGYRADTLGKFFNEYTRYFEPSKFPGQPARAELFDEVYVFEPNPKYHFEYDKLWNSGYKFELLKAAATDMDGEITFTGSGLGGSPVGKREMQNGLTVRSIDFSSWLQSKFSEEDYLICKIDIEGSEYQVVSKMIADGSFCLCDRLSFEWHAWIVHKKSNKNLINFNGIHNGKKLPERLDIKLEQKLGEDARLRDTVCRIPHLNLDVPFYYCNMPRLVQHFREQCNTSYPLEKWF